MKHVLSFNVILSLFFTVFLSEILKLSFNLKHNKTRCFSFKLFKVTIFQVDITPLKVAKCHFGKKIREKVIRLQFIVLIITNVIFILLNYQAERFSR